MFDTAAYSDHQPHRPLACCSGELRSTLVMSKALCASRITLPLHCPDSFLFRHDQRGGRQLRLAADQKSCLAPALMFCRFRQPQHTGVVPWRWSVILFSALNSAQGGWDGKRDFRQEAKLLLESIQNCIIKTIERNERVKWLGSHF